MALVATAVLLGPVPVTAAAGAAPSTDDVSATTTLPPPDVEQDRPVPTVSDFYPEDANLSDCLGLVQRPGCGSEARGGWRQTAVFGAILLGMGLIAWRISVGIRRNRATIDGRAARSGAGAGDAMTSESGASESDDA